MSATQVGLVVVIIISCLFGVWPISIAALGALLYISKVQQPEKPKGKKSIEELEKENEALHQELADQAVRQAMDKAESREKEH